MGLTNRQKQHIKKNIRALPLEKIAEELDLPEKEILKYLKKKWPSEKYRDFVRGGGEKTADDGPASLAFRPLTFLSENRFVFILLIFLVFAVYLNSLGNAFVSDDVPTLMNNSQAGSFGQIFSGPFLFSPRLLFNFLVIHIGGLHPASFRIINILFHFGSSLLVFLVVSWMAGRTVGIAAAALFAVHPILIESVTWISGAPYSQYGFFFLFSFLFYLLSKREKKYIYYSIVFYLLAVMSSEKAIGLFLVFFLYEFSFGNLRHYWKKILPFALSSIGLIMFYVSKIGGRTQELSATTYQSTSGFYNPFVQVPIAIGSYLKLIFWPDKLSLYQTEMNFTQESFSALAVVSLVFLGVVVWSYFKNKKIFFWLAFFFITLLPTLTPLKISWVVAERYVYLGTLGIIVAVVILWEKIVNLNENGKMVGYFLLALAVVGLSVRTIYRNRDWRNEDTLWVATARVAPSGQQIHNNLGDMYSRQGDMQKAIEEFSMAIQINPNYADAYHNRGNTYQQIGQNDLAIADFQKAASINPNLWQSYQNMASIYFNAGNYGLAEENIKKALEINPSDPTLQQNLQTIEENRK
ncbi:MAG: tetratricopeptide repeat protein [Candidatus Moranbacteria bacterium]|nr:tetratricopeptide repeat protein [Candidatus Moranbacteria bacterium]